MLIIAELNQPLYVTLSLRQECRKDLKPSAPVATQWLSEFIFFLLPLLLLCEAKTLARESNLVGLTPLRGNPLFGGEEVSALESYIHTYELKRSYHQLFFRYTPFVYERSKILRRRSLDLASSESNPMKKLSYQAMAHVCTFVLEGYQLHFKNKVLAEDYLQELLDVYFMATHQVDELVKFHCPNLRLKTKKELMLLKGMSSEEEDVYSFFYELVAKGLTYLFSIRVLLTR